MRTRNATGPFGNHALVGSIVILVATIATLVSFSASTGLPFVPTYRVTVELPDASRLLVGAPVRVGGARVGIVKAVHAVAPSAGRPAYARADLAIDPKLRPLPVDSLVRLRPISILGGKYLSIEVGHASRKLAHGQALPLDRAVKTVDIDQALRIFAPRTRRALQGVVLGYGDALAGRGGALNTAIGAFDHLIVPLGRVADTLAAPRTRLARFIAAGARLADALAPVGPRLHGLIEHAGPTFAALRGSDGALGRLIEGTPPLEAEVTPALAEIDPVLDDATVVSRNLRGGTKELPGAARALDGALLAAPPALRRSPVVSQRLQQLLAALRTFVRDPATHGSLRVMTQAMQVLVPLLAAVTPAQTVCDTFGLAARNLGLVRGQGDANGSFARTALYTDGVQSLQNADPPADLHDNPYANENASECEAGNEPYLPGRQVGNPPGNQPTTVDTTSPPPGVTALARAAGLLGGTAK